MQMTAKKLISPWLRAARCRRPGPWRQSRRPSWWRGWTWPRCWWWPAGRCCCCWSGPRRRRCGRPSCNFRAPKAVAREWPRRIRKRAGWTSPCRRVHCPGRASSRGWWISPRCTVGWPGRAQWTASTASCWHCWGPRRTPRTSASWCPSRNLCSSLPPTATQKQKKLVNRNRLHKFRM